MICTEITKQHSGPFLVTTWYRRPESGQNIFNNFKVSLFKSSDIDNMLETVIMGDLNCDVNKLTPDTQTRQLQSLCSLHQLSQCINVPTRVTGTTSTIIDLIFSNNPETIRSSCVLHFEISDHSLVFAIRKYELLQKRPILKEVRDFKYFFRFPVLC